MPNPEQARLAWVGRELFPPVYTGTVLDCGFVESGQSVDLLTVVIHDWTFCQ